MFGKSSDITYENIIPKEFRRRNIKPTDVIITTFTLDGTILDRVLGDMLGGSLVRMFRESAKEKKDCIRVYYDPAQFIKAGKFGSVIIKGKPQEDKCCFHPKVILIRYEEGENENKKVKYFISVSSRNMADSSSVEAYFAASGEAGKTAGNGRAIAAFLKNDIPRSDANQRMIDELEKTNFEAEGCSDIEFFRADGVAKKLSALQELDDDGLLIVSPFLNIDALYNNYAEKNIKIAGIYSKQDSFAGMKTNQLEHRLYINCDKIVHAKVYCYKKGGKTHWIIGSSNATKNGFSGNKEFNVYFTTDKDDYVKFRHLLWHETPIAQNNNDNENPDEDICLFKKYYPDDTEKDEPPASDTSSRKRLHSLMNNLSVSDGYRQQDYRVDIQLNVDAAFWENDKIRVAVSVQEDEKPKEFNKETRSITLTSAKPFYYVFVFFQFDNTEETRLISINWNGEQIIKERAESEEKEAVRSAAERERRTLRGGTRYYYNRNEATKEARMKTSAQTPKDERFEKLMNYCRNNNIDKNALKELLERLAWETPDEKARNFYQNLSQACGTYENGDMKNGK